ncbi:hypothetical protein [Cyclobacterium sp.]|uniref:hypothetical protein n=1 Tax=Cyclobacterium sp. TaxID=1966343 RepID=UPI0019C62687|nr:hypothetical protein [Cyclobacterium sp.]MBD3626790.1 hypothetical protein [Cyclobacterium sp.]
MTKEVFVSKITQTDKPGVDILISFEEGDSKFWAAGFFGVYFTGHKLPEDLMELERLGLRSGRGQTGGQAAHF